MITKLFREMRRRKVIRAAVTYVVSGWLVIQIADVLVDAFNGPGWLLQMLITAVAIGLPCALVFSWFFDISADGIKRTRRYSRGRLTNPCL